jgi:hypothetical protein
MNYCSLRTAFALMSLVKRRRRGSASSPHDLSWSVLEPLLLFENQPRRSEEREGFARALRMPDEAAGFGRIGAAIDNSVDSATLDES